MDLLGRTPKAKASSKIQADSRRVRTLTPITASQVPLLRASQLTDRTTRGTGRLTELQPEPTTARAVQLDS